MEYTPNVSAQLLIANAKAVITATPIAILGSLATTFLNPGTWLLTGYVSCILAATTVLTKCQVDFNLVTATLGTEDAGMTQVFNTLTICTGAGVYDLAVTPRIVNVPAQGVFYFLNLNTVFTTSTLTACGTFNATQLNP